MISVVMPVLNGEDLVAEAIASCEEAGAGEVVVVDDGSEDRTVEIVSGFEIVSLFHNPGPDLSYAYNKGFEQARGDRLAVIGHDDTYAPGAFAALGRALDEGAAVAWGKVEYSFVGGVEPQGYLYKPEIYEGPADAMLLECMLATREAFDLVGEMRHGVACDIDWFTRLSDSGLPLARVPELVTRKRFRADSASHVAAAEDHRHMTRALRDAILRRREGAN